MGMFDSVFAPCPVCGSEEEIQSKAGVCELKRYQHSSVPAGIAKELNGQIDRCSQCGAAFKLRADIPRVSMYIQSTGLDEDDSWD